MMKAGEINSLTVVRFTQNGAYLADEEQQEVLLPNRYLTDSLKEGDELKVFVYCDSEDRMVATTDIPYVMSGEVAQLEVVDCNRVGAFLDWGLPKDLFLPISNQKARLRSGQWVVVYVYTDTLSGRIVATMKLNEFIRNEEITVSPKEKVEIVVAEEHSLGFRVVVNNRHWGMLYSNQIFTDVRVGDILTGYVTGVSEDNRIDISIQQVGVEQIKNASGIIAALLADNGGTLAVGDKSSPEEIYSLTGLSKKMFKRGAGTLYKEGKATVGDFSISLNK